MWIGQTGYVARCARERMLMGRPLRGLGGWLASFPGARRRLRPRLDSVACSRRLDTEQVTQAREAGDPG